MLPLVFAPGTKYAYNNTGYLLLAKVIERVSGQSYDRYMTDQLFAPLGMKNTGIVTADRSVPGLVTGYSPGSSDASIQMLAAGIPLLKSGAEKSVPPTIMAGAHGEGGMYTTVEDLYRWDRALKGGSVISAASQAEIFKPGLGNYGFGWNIGMRFGESNQWHTGVLPGFVTYRSVSDVGCDRDRHGEHRLCPIHADQPRSLGPGARQTI